MRTVTIHYLPFHMGKMQCSIVFKHEQIGEMVYSIDATAALPLPMSLPFRPSTSSSRISMVAATGELAKLIIIIIIIMYI